MREGRLLTLSWAALLCVACATPPAPAPKQLPAKDEGRPVAPAAGDGVPAGWAQPAPSPIPPVADASNIDPATYIKQYPRPEYCEEAARRLQAQSRDKAWEVLKACVARGKFTLLARVIADPWAEDLKTRPEASLLLAKVVAMRGGDVAGDLGQMRARRVPLFPIAPALGHPELYKGRLVLFRAEVRDVKLASGKATAKLAEFAIGNSETYVADSDRWTSQGSRSSSYSNSKGYSSSLGGTYQSSTGKERRLTSNVPVETGVDVLARMGKVDPFFEPGRQFVVLGRFEGTRERDPDEAEEMDRSQDGPERTSKVAVVAVVSYFEPAAAIVE